MRATLFLVSRKLGGKNGWTGEGAVAGRALLSNDEARKIRGDELSIGAHTRTHPSLPDLADDAVDGEIGGSRKDLEALLDEPVTTFAYPYGRFDERAVQAAKQAGFVAACTVESRLARLGDDPHLIPRIEIRGGDSTLRFLRKLWLGGT